MNEENTQSNTPVNSAPVPTPPATTPSTPDPTVTPAPVAQPNHPVAATIAPLEPTLAPTTPPATTPATPTPIASGVRHKIPVINEADWENKEIQLDKYFYSGLDTFSPRAFYFPLNLEMDIQRSINLLQKKGYQVAENPMALDPGSKFLSQLLIEVKESEASKSGVVSLKGKTFHARIAKMPIIKLKKEREEIEKSIGKPITEFYFFEAIAASNNTPIKVYLAS